MKKWFKAIAAFALVFGLMYLGAQSPLGAQAKKDEKKDEKKDDKKDPMAKAPIDYFDKQQFVTSDGLELYSYWLAGEKTSDVVILFPAPGGQLDERHFEIGKVLGDKRFAVLMFDWRGCGINRNQPRIVKDAKHYLSRPSNKGGGTIDSLEKNGLAYEKLPNKAFVINDLVAARFEIDKKNDAGSCNSNRIWIVTEKEGCALARGFIASEFSRNSFYADNNKLAVVRNQAAGKDYAGVVFLSHSDPGTWSKFYMSAKGNAKTEMDEYIRRTMAWVNIQNKAESTNKAKSYLISTLNPKGKDEAEKLKDMKSNFKYFLDIEEKKAAKMRLGFELIDKDDSNSIKKTIIEALEGVRKEQAGGKNNEIRNTKNVPNPPEANMITGFQQ